MCSGCDSDVSVTVTSPGQEKLSSVFMLPLFKPVSDKIPIDTRTHAEVRSRK